MDETQSSRVSEAAASRKRRSSILKNHRATRTPLSELEFHVATPTDPGKSRRVSFSRRKGVAEFITNEATTTWKNFYEEHNKSLESSGNESGANAARPSISHIGKRIIFDQQFEEVEAVDFESALFPGNSRAAEFNISINNVNLTQQLVALECTVDDKKLTAPQQHFELSSLTDHQSKIFSDELTIPVMRELSNQINVNFSMMNPITSNNDKCDDLDEIQRDLERSHNVVCPGPFREQNMSEYIEVDLNMTHVAVQNDESDMSITDTVYSPKVEVSSTLVLNKSKQTITDKDWTTDKENIAVLNPYITPRESDNFAVNEEPDQVLVFDGKRLTVQLEQKESRHRDNELLRDKENHCRVNSIPSDTRINNIPQRKTIVLNTNDDLPNFNDDRSILRQDIVSVNEQELKHATIFDEGDLSMTQAVQNIVEPAHVVEMSSKSKTIISGNTTGNISLTQAISSNVILDHNAAREKRKTIIYDDSHSNISVTQAIPANILLDNKCDVTNKRRTTVYDNENVSFTEIVPTNLILPENKDKSSSKTILFQNNMDNISFTQVIPSNIHLEKSQINKTTVFEKSVSNISMTQALPSNIMLFDNEPVSKIRETIVHNNDDVDISMTQVIPGTLIVSEISKDDVFVNKRNTTAFENGAATNSLAGAVPSNIIQQKICNKTDSNNAPQKLDDKLRSDDINEKERDVPAEAISHISKKIPSKKITIMYDEHADISMTQGLPTNILSSNHNLINPNERKSEVFYNESCRTSQMEVDSHNILSKEENNAKITIHSQNHDQSLNQILSKSNSVVLKSIIIDNDESNVINEAKHHISSNTKQVIITKDISNNDIGNLSMIKPIPDNMFEIESEIFKKDMEKFGNLPEFREKILLQDNIHDRSSVDVLVYQANTQESTEIQRNTDHEVSMMKESKLSIGTDNMDGTMVKTVKNSSTNSNKTGILKVRKNDLQISLPNNGVVAEVNQGIEPASDVISQDTKRKKSILHELLNMSNTSVVDDVSDKNIVPQVDTDIVQTESMKSTENNSEDDIFIVTRDKDEKDQMDVKSIDIDLCSPTIPGVKKLAEIENLPLPALECNTENVESLEDKLLELTRSVTEKKKSPPQNRYYEKILSSDLQARVNQEVKDVADVIDANTLKSLQEADSTKDLLKVFNDFKDKNCAIPIDDGGSDVPQIKNRKSTAFENKAVVAEPKRLSFASNRQSFILTREKMLNDLSMAQATFQKSRSDLADSDIDDSDPETPPEINESIKSPKKSVRVSDDVVKTLHFEDESYIEDMRLISDVKMSPLKKTAFGETSYMKECKTNVIPTYLKDVSDNIKALMTDLVKPRPDQMPFEITTPKPKKLTATCSTQIQANLVTSSQIDLDVELQSNVNSGAELYKGKSLLSDVVHRGKKVSPKGPTSALPDVSSVDIDNKTYAIKYYAGKSSLKKYPDEPVLVFDHHNPLNNVLLGPLLAVDVHKYDPLKSSHALNAEGNSSTVSPTLNTENNSSISKSDEETKSNKDNPFEAEKIVTQYHVESLVGLQSGDSCQDKRGDSNSLFSDPSKPLSIDRSTEGFVTELKDTEVNTVIAMKGNKELLEASSSLTLVDEALTQNVFEMQEPNSPVRVIYKMEHEDVSVVENIDSDLMSNDDEHKKYHKAKKRSYKASRRDNTGSSTLSNPDVTPKPASKMQKISTSHVKQNNESASRDDSPERSDKTEDTSVKSEPRKKRSPRKSKGIVKSKKPGTDVTVQHLITKYKISQMEQDMIEDQIKEAINEKRTSSSGKERDSCSVRESSPEAVSSCTSSKIHNELQEAGVREVVSYVGSQPSKVDWQPELKELSSRTKLTECDSAVNVVAKIDMLPFMGSKECEWETSGGDAWVFRLLRARLRLRVRLTHRHHNALRTRVRADTPVTEIAVDPVPVEEKDPLAALCIRFAAEAMRYECARGNGCVRAGDVPLVLRRCGGVARVALRWARAMRDARTRLAYTLTDDGLLTLKVANVPLRSVWEVSLRLELVVEDAREAAWPRATAVRVRGVLADCAVGEREVDRVLGALGHDWGHAPRAIWKIFRYLKNKTREDDFLRLGTE